MGYTTLISAVELASQRGDSWAIVDCRVGRDHAGGGRAAYAAGHIPGAVYAQLEEDLSGAIIPGRTGRHPLPDIAAMAQRLSTWGIDSHTQVVAYDDSDGALAAARLWWILRWLGHSAVAVLDGGLAAWARAGLPLHSGPEARGFKQFVAQPRHEMVVDAAAVLRATADPAAAIIDARTTVRYLGQSEPLDSVAGHIPRALSYPYQANLQASGEFLPPEALQQRFSALAHPHAPDQIIAYCGSGVTAAHNLLALEHAGIPNAKLYAGSWSDWITDSQRPIAGANS